MPTDHRAQLAKIKTFPQLIAYLRDEMGWPIDASKFEDLTFEYTAEELGIDARNAAKIQEIKRLRPLYPRQPWGIFFVKFEPKRVQAGVLRAVLGRVVLKKRASANSGDRQAWAADDLLFISAFGADDERRMVFAHFSQPADREDLPVLKVVDWNHLHTDLHLDDVARKLTTSLAWPDDPEAVEKWRNRWQSAFELRPRETVTTSKQLSIRLAHLARSIRDRITDAIAIETERGPLTKLMKAFQEALVHDLNVDGFADMYAQTIAYGLLSARIADPHKKTADDFAAHMRTNPFLRELMETFLKVGGRRGKVGGPGIDFDELGVSEVVELLDDANMEAVVRDFGDRNPQEDPVTHFYEGFAKEYAPIDKVKCGEFYTPRSVVSYIVRSVDELLRTEFGLADGLADTTTWGEMVKRHKGMKVPEGVSPDQDFVQILDPATGTGTFLVEVIDLVHKTLVAKWGAQGHEGKRIEALWNEYVPRHLLTRLYAYELKMAPYAIAHLKIRLKLIETRYRFGSDERAHVYLTNALEPAGDKQLTLDFLPALAHEAQAVNDVKSHQRFTVVIGNPPYLGEAGTGGEWIAGLMRGQDTVTGRKTASYFEVAGSPLKERNSKWINDDYVKFTRLSHFLLDTTGCGVHGYISNHGYLDNPTFRGMRWALLASFDQLHALDLHGNLKKKEATPTGGKDVNVFDIEQGVGIGLFIKQRFGTHDVNAAAVRHSDVWGEQTAKYDWLINHNWMNTDWAQVDASPPFYLFEPLDSSEVGEYFAWPAINVVMPTNSVGVVTSRDEFVIDMDRATVLSRVSDFVHSNATDSSIRAKYLSEKDKLPVRDARLALRKDDNLKQRIQPVLYRPFDRRWICYHPAVIERPRTEAMPHMLAGENLAIMIGRAGQVIGSEDWDIVHAGRDITEFNCYRRGGNNLFPLYLYPGAGKADRSMFHTWPEGKSGRRPNLEPGFVESIEQATGLTFISDGRGDLKSSGRFGPEDVLAYIYALFHCPEYRRRFEPMLMLDFPRVPPPGAAEPFTALARLGHDLLSLHLLESPKLAKPITEFVGGRNPEVEKVSWSKSTVWLDNAQTAGFRGVPEDVWSFCIGGYQVCEKWLKDRGPKKGKPGRTLTKDDIAHYRKIVVALAETIGLMKEIDEIIEKHGGWPGAFARAPAPAH